jgi:hypothetical protein
LRTPAAQNLEQELVREEAFALLVGALPFLEHRPFQATHRFLFRYAGVGDAVQVPLEQFLLVVRM